MVSSDMDVAKRDFSMNRHTFKVHWDYVKRLGLVDNNLLGMPRRPCLAVRQYRWLVGMF